MAHDRAHGGVAGGAGAVCLGRPELAQRGRGAEALLAGVLAGLFLVLPVIAYVQADYLPMVADGWQLAAPALAIHAAASAADVAWSGWVTAAYALAGAACLGLRWVRRT